MLISALLILPLLFSIVVMALPRAVTRIASLLFAISEFALSLMLLCHFSAANPAVQLTEQHAWVPELGISYFVGIDGISILLVLLTTFLLPLTILASWKGIDRSIKGFHAALFVLQTAMIGSFVALDAILFYTFFELTLVPMYFLIGMWGGPRRLIANIKFFLFTMLGSLLMLLAIIYLMFSANDALGHLTSNLLELYTLKTPFIAGEFINPQTLLFFAFSLAFSIKVAVFPLHAWLPDAYGEAPTAATVLLSGVLLKMGTYGFLRFVIPLFPEAVSFWAWLFMFLGAVSLIYGALMALVQPNMKRLVAYSSMSHMGYVMIGLFALNTFSVSGAWYQMLNHGLSTGGLFLLIGLLMDRAGSDEIKRFGGLASYMPCFTIAFVIVSFSSMAVPLTGGFIGEFLILLGAFSANKMIAGFAISGVVLGAAYLLWMIKRVFYGPAGELALDPSYPLKDMSVREWAIAIPLVIMILWMGLFPNQFLHLSQASIDHLITDKDNYTLVRDR